MKIWGPQRHESNDVTKKPTNFNFTYRYSCEVTGSKIVSFYILTLIRILKLFVFINNTKKSANFILMIFFFLYQLFTRQCYTLPKTTQYIWLNKKPRGKCTYPFLCGLKLTGVRDDVDCSASLCCFSSATLSLVTICSSICIFSMLLAVSMRFLHGFIYSLQNYGCIKFQAIKSIGIVFVFVFIDARSWLSSNYHFSANINAKGCNFKCKHY